MDASFSVNSILDSTESSYEDVHLLMLPRGGQLLSLLFSTITCARSPLNEIVPKAERNLGGSAPSLAVWHSITRNTIGFHEAPLINRNKEGRSDEPSPDSVEGS